MEIPILAGRAIDKRDVDGAPAVGVVNPVFAEKYFHGENPIGRHFRLGGTTTGMDIEIVGGANGALQFLKREIPPVTYTSWLQTPKTRRLKEMIFELRTIGDPLRLSNTVRQIVHQVGPQVPLADMTTQSRRIDQTILQERTYANSARVSAALLYSWPASAYMGPWPTQSRAVVERLVFESPWAPRPAVSSGWSCAKSHILFRIRTADRTRSRLPDHGLPEVVLVWRQAE